MRDAPRQPKNLDPIDESTLAELGHMIEGWQGMKNTSVPLEQRREKFLYELESQYQRLHESGEIYPPDVFEMLDINISELEELHGSEEEIAGKCDEVIEYWKGVRRDFIKEIS